MAELCVGVLALQGAFREHAAVLGRLGVGVRQVRQLRHLDGINAMVIPGGESTTMGKLLTELGILAPLQQRIEAGMPVYGSCAGLILLCRQIEDSDQPRLGVLDATVRRNAFGRQVDSYEEDLHIRQLGPQPVRAVFIRAPWVEQWGSEVEVLASVRPLGREHPVAVRQGNLLATSFHPEVTGDHRFHSHFVATVRGTVVA